jgi:UDP-2-acetamido-3-amino-2,3-dideoxy-glucuronate N-acetyltransferase
MENKYWAHETAFICPEAKIGEGTKIWNHCQILSGCQIGDNCTIGHNILVASTVKIGNNVKIQSNTDVWQGVELQDYVFVGPSVVFTNDFNPRAEFPKNKGEYLKTLVKIGATLGANSTIICDNEIGKYAFVGAGAVITKNVPDYAIVVGNPARIIGYMCRCGQKLNFDGNNAKCDKCQRNYSKNGEIVNEI